MPLAPMSGAVDEKMAPTVPAASRMRSDSIEFVATAAQFEVSFSLNCYHVTTVAQLTRHAIPLLHSRMSQGTGVQGDLPPELHPR